MKSLLCLPAIFLIALSLSQPAFSQSAADLYSSKCKMCHGADGKGNTPVAKTMGVHDFKSPEVAKESAADMIAVTKNGKNKMPAYKDKLTDDQIKELVTYLRGL
jgi:cytochrome c6